MQTTENRESPEGESVARNLVNAIIETTENAIKEEMSAKPSTSSVEKQRIDVDKLTRFLNDNAAFEAGDNMNEAELEWIRNARAKQRQSFYLRKATEQKRRRHIQESEQQLRAQQLKEEQEEQARTKEAEEHRMQMIADIKAKRGELALKREQQKLQHQQKTQEAKLFVQKTSSNKKLSLEETESISSNREIVPQKARKRRYRIHELRAHERDLCEALERAELQGKRELQEQTQQWNRKHFPLEQTGAVIRALKREEQRKQHEEQRRFQAMELYRRRQRYSVLVRELFVPSMDSRRQNEISRRIKSLEHPEYWRATRDVKHLYGVPRQPRRCARASPTKVELMQDVRPMVPDYVREMREHRERLQMSKERKRQDDVAVNESIPVLLEGLKSSEKQLKRKASNVHTITQSKTTEPSVELVNELVELSDLYIHSLSTKMTLINKVVRQPKLHLI